MTSEPRLLVLAAETSGELERATDDLAARLAAEPETDLTELANELWTAASSGDHRRIVVASDATRAASDLAKRNRRRVFTGSVEEPGPNPVFLFSGVGEQYPEMAAGLYAHLPVFRAELDRCLAILDGELRLGVRAVLHLGRPEDGPDGGPERAHARSADLTTLFDRREAGREIDRTAVAQPLMFAVQFALARTLTALGVVPAAMAGYSLGEYVAACVAGVLPLDDALRLVATRARLIGELPEGAMLAAAAGPDAVRPCLDGSVTIAALDGPELTVLAGTVDGIDRAERRLSEAGVPVRRLAASHAFHSPLMEPVAAPLAALLDGVELRPPTLPFVSDVTGSWIGAEEATSPAYWAGHLHRPIRFDDGLRTIWSLPRPAPLELGPGQTLAALALRHTARPESAGPLAAPPLKTLPGHLESSSDLETLLTTLGRLWTAGVPVVLPCPGGAPHY
ncbi:acyltransferase domain-containing protein [Actinomadura gamaensis]|uniref:Acyltransferase domain-containing protein n=1 Tax=Actinomadura gamaensis TaxID=1763541 RepID=A0ABV9TXR4_9ACTN